MKLDLNQRKLSRVPLHTEGVDRNGVLAGFRAHSQRSPSTRRVWIEIVLLHGQWRYRPVTLHTEGVDRN